LIAIHLTIVIQKSTEKREEPSGKLAECYDLKSDFASAVILATAEEKILDSGEL
jgi:hypothetical protein